MKRFLVVAFSLFLLMNGFNINAQSKEILISGRVISFEESFPMEGAGVSVKGTKYATGTLPDGSFSLKVLPEHKTLVVKLEGYTTQEVPITKARDYEVVLRLANDATFLTTIPDKWKHLQTLASK